MAEGEGAEIDEAYARFLDACATDSGTTFEEFLSDQPEGWREELRALHVLTEAVLPELSGPEQGVAPELGGADARYRIDGELGAGGMGEVYRVYDTRLERHLAMKVARGGGRREQRFLAEARVASRLDHPGIAPVHDLDLDAAGRPFFTMAEVRGRTFEALIEAARAEREGWSTTRAVGVLLRVTDAMAYAHSRGVVHRDLKPANVMVGEFGETYVLDWGLARVSDVEDDLGSAQGRADSDAPLPGLTADGDVVGTPAYMAPEQARGELAAVGPGSDVYAVGCMLYQLLCGKAPFAGEPNVLLAARERAPEALASGVGVPRELVAIAERAMQREPAGRYASMSELGSDLRAYLEGRVVRAYESGGLAELRKWFGRNTKLAGALAGAVLAVLAGVAATFYFQGLEQARGLRFYDLQLVREAVLEAEFDLWPERPETLGAMDAWLARNRPLAARLPLHRETLRQTLAEAAALRERERSEDADGAPRWTFDDPDRRWRHEQLEQLVAELEAFSGPEGELDEVLNRRDWAATVVEQTLEAPAEDWARAASAVAADPRFEGVQLAPQLGLIPLGADPASGLQEFALARSGTTPQRGADGVLALSEESAAVLVLLPPATFTMGVEDSEESRMLKLAQPAHEVTLAAFFMGKHELTYEHWERLGGVIQTPPSRPRLPLAHVSCLGAQSRLQRHGLTLPTEARWEYAALALAETGYPWGDDFERVHEFTNLRTEGSDPIGELSANAFGLHDMVGNISEWCLDGRGDYTMPARGPAGLRDSHRQEIRAYRGVGFVGLNDFAGPTVMLPRFRLWIDGRNTNHAVGVRIARDLVPGNQHQGDPAPDEL